MLVLLVFFINSIFPNLKKLKLNETDVNILNNNDEYNLYLNFIHYILKITNNNDFNLYFYNLYEKFNDINMCDSFNLDKDIEFQKFVPTTINYRNLYNNKLFCINYSIDHYCTGLCKFKKN